jgi:hypothetical protein
MFWISCGRCDGFGVRLILQPSARRLRESDWWDSSAECLEHVLAAAAEPNACLGGFESVWRFPVGLASLTLTVTVMVDPSSAAMHAESLAALSFQVAFTWPAFRVSECGFAIPSVLLAHWTPALLCVRPSARSIQAFAASCVRTTQ